MKKFTLLTIACITAFSALPLSALNITLDGQPKTVSSKIVNDRTMIPLREFGDLMGYKTNYVSPKNIQVYNPMNEEKIILAIDVAEVKDSHGNTFKASAAPKKIDGTTYVPLRVVAENLGVKVSTDKKGNIVLKTEYHVNLGNALEQNGNKITPALEADFAKNKESVKVAQGIYSKYASLSVAQLKGKQGEILKDIEQLTTLKVLPNSLSQVFMGNVMDFLRNENSLANSVNAGQDTSILEVYRNTHKTNLSERVEYIKKMK